MFADYSTIRYGYEWLPPPIGVTKINFDTLVISRKATAGFVNRDEHGQLIIERGRPLLHSSVPYTEMAVAWLEFQVAHKHLKHNLIVWI